MDDIKLHFGNDSNYYFEIYAKKKSNEFYLQIIKKKKKKLSDALELFYDENKKLKLKILNIVDLPSIFRTVGSITKKYIIIDYLYINFKTVDEAVIEKFILAFNLFKPFKSPTNTLKTIELNFEDCSVQNQKDHDISKIYNWRNLNRLRRPADRHKIIWIKNWNLEELNHLRELINLSNFLEFYLLNCKLKIDSDDNISIQVKNKEVKIITDNFNISIYKDLIEDKLQSIWSYDIKLAISFIQESYVLYMDFLNTEDKKVNIRTKVLNAWTHALENYLIDKENNIQFDFCSIKVVLECPDSSNKNLKILFEEYKNNRISPKFYGMKFKKENKSKEKSEMLNEALSKCKLEISNQYIAPSNLVIILSLGTIVNEMRFNNWTLVLQSYDDLNQYLNFGGQIYLK